MTQRCVGASLHFYYLLFRLVAQTRVQTRLRFAVSVQFSHLFFVQSAIFKLLVPPVYWHLLSQYSSFDYFFGFLFNLRFIGGSIIGTGVFLLLDLVKAHGTPPALSFGLFAFPDIQVLTIGVIVVLTNSIDALERLHLLEAPAALQLFAPQNIGRVNCLVCKPLLNPENLLGFDELNGQLDPVRTADITAFLVQIQIQQVAAFLVLEQLEFLYYGLVELDQRLANLESRHFLFDALTQLDWSDEFEQSPEFRSVVLNRYSVIFFNADHRVDPGDRNVSYFHVCFDAPAHLEDPAGVQIEHVHDFGRCALHALHDHMVPLGSLEVDDLVEVGLQLGFEADFAQLALEGFPKETLHSVAIVDQLLGVQPLFQAVYVDVLHRARAVARTDQVVLVRLLFFASQTHSAHVLISGVLFFDSLLLLVVVQGQFLEFGLFLFENRGLRHC